MISEMTRPMACVLNSHLEFIPQASARLPRAICAPLLYSLRKEKPKRAPELYSSQVFHSQDSKSFL